MTRMRYTTLLAALAAFAAASTLEAQGGKRKVRDAGFTQLLPCCRVVAIDAAANAVSVKDEKTGTVFRMPLGPARARPAGIATGTGGGGATLSLAANRSSGVSTNRFRPGQMVFMNVLANRAAAASLPVTVKQKNNITRSSWKMETTVTVSNNGRIDGITKTKTSEAMRGFTGGVLVGITDLEGNVLHYTKLRTYGVDGTAKPGGKSSRTESWSEQVPQDVINKAAAVVIWHSHQPKNRFPGAVEWVKENWQCIVEVYRLVNPDSAAADTAPAPGTSEPPSGSTWGTTTPEETMEILSTCKNLFGD